jgi:hypothetical protein
MKLFLFVKMRIKNVYVKITTDDRCGMAERKRAANGVLSPVAVLVSSHLLLLPRLMYTYHKRQGTCLTPAVSLFVTSAFDGWHST